MALWRGKTAAYVSDQRAQLLSRLRRLGKALTRQRPNAINARDSADGVNSDTLAKFGGWDPKMTLDGTLMVLKTVLSEDTTPKT